MNRRAFHTKSVLLILFLMLLPLGHSAQADDPPADKPTDRIVERPIKEPTLQELLPGTWSLLYHDSALGEVSGVVHIDAKLEGATVTLHNPKSKVAYDLHSSKLTVTGQEVTIILEGKSPVDAIAGRVDRTDAKTVLVPDKAETMQVRVVGGGKSALPIQERGEADLDRVEITMTLGKGSTLSGTWHYRADLITQRDREGGGRVGQYSLDPKDPTVGRQSGTEMWWKSDPMIAGTVVLQDQLSATHGLVNYKAPDPTSTDSITRTLFVFGRHLPKKWTDPIHFESGDPKIGYRIMGFTQPPKGGNVWMRDEFQRAWDKTEWIFPKDQHAAIRKMDTLIIRVTLKHDVTAGTKSFRLNGAQTTWPLRFGDNTARVSFVRNIQDGLDESTETLFLPERVRIDLRTRPDFALREIPLLMALIPESPHWSGKDPLIARFVKKIMPARKSGQSWSTVSKKPTALLFSTGWINLYEQGKAKPPGEGLALIVKPGDKLMIRPKDSATINTASPAAIATVYRTPAELGSLWKEALRRAAKAKNIPVNDWSTVGAKEIEELSNVIILQAEIASIKVTLRDLAAMILLRDEFVRATKEHLAGLEKIKTEQEHYAFISKIGPMMMRSNFPLARAKVKGPNGKPVQFSLAWMPEFVAEQYELSPNDARHWCYLAKQHGLPSYLYSVRESIKQANRAGDGGGEDQVETLLRLTGYSFDAMANRLLPKLMKLEEVGTPPRQKWMPDKVARAAVRGIRKLGEAFKAQEDYSSTDTMVAQVMLVALTFPAMFSGGAFYAAVALVADVGDAALVYFVESEHWEREDAEYKFAVAAEGVLGSERRLKAEAERTPEWARMLSVAGAVIGPLGSISDLKVAIKSKDLLKAQKVATKLMPKLEKGGSDALKLLTQEEKLSLAAYLADAEKMLATDGVDALTSMQRRALLYSRKAWKEAGAVADASKIPMPPKVREARELATLRPDEIKPLLSPEVRSGVRNLTSRMRAASKKLDDLEKAGVKGKALDKAKEAVTDLKRRKEIFDTLRKEAANTSHKQVKMTDEELSWLSGAQRGLTKADQRAARATYMDQYKGNWKKIAKAYNKGDISDVEMHKLTSYRKREVDEMLDSLIKAEEAKTGAKIERKAFGSTNPTSDYDLSISGPGAENVVRQFNRKFRNKFRGREAGSVFDTNVYTDPVYDMIHSGATLTKGQKMTPGQIDDLRQFMYTQMAHAKYMGEGQWNDHVKLLLKASPEEMRSVVGRVLKEVEGRERAGRELIAKALAKAKNVEDPNTLLRVNNDLYGELLGRISTLRKEADRVADLGKGDAATHGPLPKIFQNSAYANDLKRYDELVASGKLRDAAALKRKLQAQMANHLRNNQGMALYFASEAYQAEGTIAHVVGELQAGGRKITTNALSGPPPKKPKLSRGQYLNSFYENRANLFKELNDLGTMTETGRMTGKFADPTKAAIKSAKYFVRQLDAAHHGGIHLTKVLPKDLQNVIEATVELDKVRGDPKQFTSMLETLKLTPDEYVAKVQKASDLLTGETMSLSPLRKHAGDLNKYYSDLDKEIMSIPGVEDPMPIPKRHPAAGSVESVGPPRAATPMDVATETRRAGPANARGAVEEMIRNRTAGKKPTPSQTAKLDYLKKSGDRQETLEAMIEAARMSGVPGDDIRLAVGPIKAFKETPSAARAAAAKRIERLLAEQAGMQIIDPASAQRQWDIINRVTKNSATAADKKALADAIVESARRGENYFDELSRVAATGKQGDLRRVADDNAISRLHKYAEANNLIPHTDMPMLRGGDAFVAKPLAGKGTPPQFFNDTCGLMVVHGMLRDRGFTNLLPEAKQRAAALAANLFEPGTGMSSNQLAGWINKMGGNAVQANRPITLTDIQSELAKGRDVSTMIRTTPEGADPVYHWVRVEGFTRGPNGRQWVSVGDPASGKSWKQLADVFYNQMNREQAVVADWSQAGKNVPPNLKPDPNAPRAGDPLGGVTDANSGKTLELPDGPAITLGKRIGKGKNFSVYDVVDKKDLAAKLCVEGDTSAFMQRTQAEVVRSVARASKELEKAGIPHLKLHSAHPNADTPFVLQKKVTEAMTTFTDAEVNYATRDALVAANKWSDAHEDAVIDLYAKLLENKLVWLDGHLGNLYFEEVDGTLVAGILDVDRIAPWSEVAEIPHMQGRLDWWQMKPHGWNTRSMAGFERRREYDSLEMVLTKMFEYGRYVEFTAAGKFESRLIDPNKIRKKFDLDKWVPKPDGAPSG